MIDLADEPLLVREEGSATRRVTERALEQAGVGRRVSMELGHTEAIKRAVMAGLGVAFVSAHAVRGDVIHSEARTLSFGARALVAMLSAAAKRG